MKKAFPILTGTVLMILLFINPMPAQAQLEFEVLPYQFKQGPDNSQIRTQDSKFLVSYDDFNTWEEVPKPEVDDPDKLNLRTNAFNYQTLVYQKGNMFYYSRDIGQTWGEFEFPVGNFTGFSYTGADGRHLVFFAENYEGYIPWVGSYKYDIDNDIFKRIYSSSVDMDPGIRVVYPSNDPDKLVLGNGFTYGFNKFTFYYTIILEYDTNTGNTSDYSELANPIQCPNGLLWDVSVVAFTEINENSRFAGSLGGLFQYNPDEDEWFKREEEFNRVFAMTRANGELYLLGTEIESETCTEQISPISLYKSIDEGETWNPVQEFDMYYDGDENSLKKNRMFFMNDHLYIQLDDKMYKSTTTVNVEDETSGLPSEFVLKNNYPNPFNPTTNINFALPEAGDVTLQVFDVTGRLIQTLHNGRLGAGTHTMTWNAGQHASGMYFYRVMYNNMVKTGKMTLVK